MISDKESKCPKCNGDLKYYDKVKRTVKTKDLVSKRIKIRRFRCVECRSIHRELPDSIQPYKQYEDKVIKEVRDGSITPATLGYENYPCESTMSRWKSRKRSKNFGNYILKRCYYGPIKMRQSSANTSYMSNF